MISTISTHRSVALSIPPWLEEICVRLRSNDESLTNLNLNIRHLPPVSFAYLWDALEENTVLKTLNLTNSLVPPLDLRPLLRGLAHHGSLTTLYLSYNKLVDVSLLAMVLRTNTSLENLFLDYNRVQDDAVLLANALNYNRTLKTLHLGKNQIDDTGATALADMLTVNTTLQRISLLSNSIRTLGITDLIQGLRQNVTLQFLEVERNPGMTVHFQSAVDQLCQTNCYGRYLLQYPGLPDGIWSHVLARSGGRANQIFFFLQSKPDLCRNCTTGTKDDLCIRGRIE